MDVARIADEGDGAIAMKLVIVCKMREEFEKLERRFKAYFGKIYWEKDDGEIHGLNANFTAVDELMKVEK